jgi:uncharacterized protein YPO0396
LSRSVSPIADEQKLLLRQCEKQLSGKALNQIDKDRIRGIMTKVVNWTTNHLVQNFAVVHGNALGGGNTSNVDPTFILQFGAVLLLLWAALGNTR